MGCALGTGTAVTRVIAVANIPPLVFESLSLFFCKRPDKCADYWELTDNLTSKMWHFFTYVIYVDGSADVARVFTSGMKHFERPTIII